MNKPNDNIEQHFQQALKDHEMPYDPNAWKAVNQKMADKGMRSSTNSTRWSVAAGIAAVTAVLAGIFFFSDDAAYEGTDQSYTKLHTENNGIDVITPKVEETSKRNIQKEQKQNINQDEDLKDQSVEPNSDKAKIPHAVYTHLPMDSDLSTSSLEQKGKHKDDTPKKLKKETQDTSENANAKGGNYIGIWQSSSDLCLDDSVELKVTHPEESGDLEFEWKANDTVKTGTKVKFAFKEAGKKTIEFNLNRYGNLWERRVQHVNVHPFPDNKIITEPPQNKVWPKHRFKLQGYDDSIKNVTWKVDNRTFDGQSFKYMFREGGVHRIQAEITSNIGCKNTVEEEINIKDGYNLLAPNAIKPTDDDIRNSTFMPAALKVLDRPFEMIIYNRNNEVMYRTNRSNEPWTGVNRKTGEIANSTEVYVWVVKLQDENGEEEIFYGHVTLIN